MTSTDTSFPTKTGVERIQSLIDLTAMLSDIMREENALLDAHRPSAIAPLQQRKAQLAAAYAQSIKEIAADRRAVSGADESLLGKLRAITKDFEAHAQKQHTLLAAAQQASEGIVKAVAAEAADAEKQQGYQLRASITSTTSSIAPIAVDENA